MNLENQQQSSADFNLGNTDDSALMSIQELLSIGDEDEKEEIEKGDEIELPSGTSGEEEEIEFKSPISTEEEEEEEEEESKQVKADNLLSDETADYKSLVKELWGDSIEIISETDEEGNEVEIKLDDATIDKSKFMDIVKAKLSDIEESYKDKVSLDSVSDFTKHLVSIEKNGGNVTEAIDLYNKYQDPFASLDLESKEDQISAIVMRHRAQGTPEADIKDLVDAYEIKDQLKEKAILAKEEVDAAVKKRLKAMEQESIDTKKRHEESLKQYKKDLKSVASTLNVKDSLKNKIVEAATVKGEDGRYEIDNIYNQIRMSPDKLAEMALYLMDREAFVKQVTEKSLISDRKDTMKKLKLIPSKTKTTMKNKVNSDDNEVTIEELLKK